LGGDDFTGGINREEIAGSGSIMIDAKKPILKGEKI
jgi:hypothetical protein